MTISIPNLLLADIEGFFGIVFFLIAFVGWVINLVNQNTEQNKKQQQQRRPPAQSASRRKQNVQSEIDQFLNQSRQSAGRSTTSVTDEVEVISPPPTRRPPPRRRRTREEVVSKQAGRSTPQLVNKPKSRSSQGLAARHLESQKKQKNQKREPLSHLSEQVEQDLPHNVDAHVLSHLDSFTAENLNATGQLGLRSTTVDRKTKASAFGRLLRSKTDIRNAIVLNEILSPPKALRR